MLLACQTFDFTPKSYAQPGQSCTQPGNVLNRAILTDKAAGAGNGGENFVLVAAASDSEVSIDQPGKGGVASQAWLACLTNGAADKNGSGGLSADEVRQCAQEHIEKQLQNVPGALPHHLSVNGNPAMILSYAARGVAAEVASGPDRDATATTPVVKASALGALNDIYNSRDDRRLVTMTASKSHLSVGRDHFDFTLASREGGFV